MDPLGLIEILFEDNEQAIDGKVRRIVRQMRKQYLCDDGSGIFVEKEDQRYAAFQDDARRLLRAMGYIGEQICEERIDLPRTRDSSDGETNHAISPVSRISKVDVFEYEKGLFLNYRDASPEEIFVTEDLLAKVAVLKPSIAKVLRAEGQQEEYRKYPHRTWTGVYQKIISVDLIKPYYDEALDHFGILSAFGIGILQNLEIHLAVTKVDNVLSVLFDDNFYGLYNESSSK